jgi:hypothetical protein
MNTDNNAEAMAKKYSQKANEFMDKVTDDQNEEIKKRVEPVQSSVNEVTKVKQDKK